MAMSSRGSVLAAAATAAVLAFVLRTSLSGLQDGEDDGAGAIADILDGPARLRTDACMTAFGRTGVR